jgi:hypothetical protein
VIVLTYLDSQDELKDSDENRQEFAEYALNNLRFLYKKANGEDKSVCAAYYSCLWPSLHGT